MKIKLSTVFRYFIMVSTLYLFHSCKPKEMYASAVVNNDVRVDYYKPFFESAQFNTKIIALTNINAVYKAAHNFSVNTMFVVNTANDSLYKLKSGIRSFQEKKQTNLLYSNLIPASAEDIENFKKLKNFLNDGESITLVYTSTSENHNAPLEVYFVYTTDISDKIKQESLPMNQFTDIKELTILDISTNEK